MKALRWRIRFAGKCEIFIVERKIRKLFVHALRDHVAELGENALVVVDLLETGLEYGGDAVLIGVEEGELIQLSFFVGFCWDIVLSRRSL
jgi:hypothetical protein